MPTLQDEQRLPTASGLHSSNPNNTCMWLQLSDKSQRDSVSPKQTLVYFVAAEHFLSRFRWSSVPDPSLSLGCRKPPRPPGGREGASPSTGPGPRPHAPCLCACCRCNGERTHNPNPPHDTVRLLQGLEAQQLLVPRPPTFETIHLEIFGLLRTGRVIGSGPSFPWCIATPVWGKCRF